MILYYHEKKGQCFRRCEYFECFIHSKKCTECKHYRGSSDKVVKCAIDEYLINEEKNIIRLRNDNTRKN